MKTLSYAFASFGFVIIAFVIIAIAIHQANASENSKAWNRMMEHFTEPRSEECTEKLDEHISAMIEIEGRMTFVAHTQTHTQDSTWKQTFASLGEAYKNEADAYTTLHEICFLTK